MLMNYTYQSFNMRGKSKVRPYYGLVANIAADKLGHIKLVATPSTYFSTRPRRAPTASRRR